ncbi:hypothetical protein Ddc_00133 [Ditylenchus destructor]|nr:hypothetical protein Ddc_00133 [Ditylenchus destructor]
MLTVNNFSCRMIFPVSQNVRSRRLILRNTNNKGFLVKIMPSSLKLLSITPLSPTGRSIYLVEAHSTVYITVSLDQRGFNIDKDPEEMRYLHLDVYCVDQLHGKPTLREWLDSDSHPQSELVATLDIVRSRQLAVLETLLELPGKAHLINPITRPTYGVDDSDCVTAHHVDSGTATVIPLTSDEVRELLPSDTMLRTATVVEESWCLAALKAVAGGLFTCVAEVYAIIFPAPIAETKTPPYELATPPNSELQTPPNAELATPPDAVFANHVTKSKLWSECNFGSRAKCSSFSK